MSRIFLVHGPYFLRLVVVLGVNGDSCPWVGTAIGSRNMFWFRVFVGMVPVCIFYDVLINIFGV